MGVVGLVLIVLGLGCILLGMIAGVREVFRRQNEPGAQALLPTALLELLKELLGAPRDKFYVIVGFLLVLVGLGLTGADVIGS